MSEVDIRPIVIEAFELKFPKYFGTAYGAPTSVYQSLQGIGKIESNHAKGWKTAEGKSSNNVGAVQASRPPCNLVSSFQYTDTHPNPDGTSTPYQICFKRYPTLTLGYADVAGIMFKESNIAGVKRRHALIAAAEGDIFGVSSAMYYQHYYEGFGSTVATRINNHYKALIGAVIIIAQALNEPMPNGSKVPMATIRRGSKGEPVKEWQRILNYDLHENLVVDGMFGGMTEQWTKVWQIGHSLNPDGVVGPLTWKAAERA